MIELLDYILDDNDNFWIITNITNNIPEGMLIYKVSQEGRYNNITKKKYIKCRPQSNLDEVPQKYKQIFKPREFYKKNKTKLTDIWKKYVDVLNEIGIEDNYIGVFGSYLIGFDIIKDVDFVIYKKENLHKYYNNINYIRKKLNVTSITKDHINYQYNKHKENFNPKCDLKEIISRNWSGIELDNGILSTPRFIDENNIDIPKKNGVDKLIEVKVLEGFYSVMLPREAIVEYKEQIYKVLTPFWKFQSFAHPGDIIKIFGNVDDKNKLVILDNCKHYIKYINKSNEIL